MQAFSDLVIKCLHLLSNVSERLKDCDHDLMMEILPLTLSFRINIVGRGFYTDFNWFNYIGYVFVDKKLMIEQRRVQSKIRMHVCAG